MSFRSGVLLALALVCAGAAGVSGTRWYDERLVRKAQASEANDPLSVVEVAHCENLVGAFVVTRDGKIWQLPSPAVMNTIESILPKERKGRIIVKGGCDTQA